MRWSRPFPLARACHKPAAHAWCVLSTQIRTQPGPQIPLERPDALGPSHRWGWCESVDYFPSAADARCRGENNKRPKAPALPSRTANDIRAAFAKRAAFGGLAERECAPREAIAASGQQIQLPEF